MYMVLQEAERPSSFIHISAYTDEAALQSHITAEPMATRIREVLEPAIVELVTFTHYTLVDGKFPTPLSAFTEVSSSVQ